MKALLVEHSAFLPKPYTIDQLHTILSVNFGIKPHPLERPRGDCGGVRCRLTRGFYRIKFISIQRRRRPTRSFVGELSAPSAIVSFDVLEGFRMAVVLVVEDRGAGPRAGGIHPARLRANQTALAAKSTRLGIGAAQRRSSSSHRHQPRVTMRKPGLGASGSSSPSRRAGSVPTARALHDGASVTDGMKACSSRSSGFLAKPYDITQLSTAVAAMVAGNSSGGAGFSRGLPFASLERLG